VKVRRNADRDTAVVDIESVSDYCLSSRVCHSRRM
jgi:hypothetical protein